MRRLPILALAILLPLPALVDTGTTPGPITA